jgi:predicted PhzF superfamily epimerase YddE/YHI9
MGRPSLLSVEADFSGGNIAEIRVSGGSVVVSHGEMNIPEGA